MDPAGKSGSIDWDAVAARLPGTAQDLLREVRAACEEHPEDAARAIERTLRARIAELRTRFGRATGGES